MPTCIYQTLRILLAFLLSDRYVEMREYTTIVILYAGRVVFRDRLGMTSISLLENFVGLVTFFLISVKVDLGFALTKR